MQHVPTANMDRDVTLLSQSDGGAASVPVEHALATDIGAAHPEPRNPRANAWAWLPIPILVAAILVLWVVDLRGSFDPPWLLFTLSFIFATLASVVIAFLVSRTFLATGKPGFFLLNCGVVFWGLAGATSAAVGGADYNASLTIHNLCAWLAALCHLTGVVLLNRAEPIAHNRIWWLLAGLVGTAGAVALVASAALAGATPTFFVQGHGGTPFRHLVLGSAAAMFVLSAIVLRPGHGAGKLFARWYALALLLFAAGMFGLMIQSVHGSALGWTARSAQWVGGIYLLVAAVAARRESPSYEVSLSVSPDQKWLRYTLAVVFVTAAVTVRLVFLQSLEAEAVTIMLYPAVIFAALYGGRGPGLLAAGLSVVAIDFFWLGRFAEFGVSQSTEWLVIAIFLANSVLIVWVADALQKSRARVAIIEAEARVAALQRHAEEALRDAHAQLADHAEQLEKLVQQRTAKLQETVSELQHISYAMAHDMRAPLRAMSAFATLLSEEAAGGATPVHTEEYARRITVAASRLDRLIQDALNYTKVVQQEMPIGPVDLSKLVRDLIETYPNLHPDKANISVEGPLPLVPGNDSLLTQCFSNLLGNAVKFVPPGIKPEVRIWCENKPGAVRVWVKDNGIGIPKHAQQRLFNMFQKLHDRYEGTGIGLAIVRKVVDRMGGNLGVESEPGHGSSFWVELPIADGADTMKIGGT